MLINCSVLTAVFFPPVSESPLLANLRTISLKRLAQTVVSTNMTLNQSNLNFVQISGSENSLKQLSVEICGFYSYCVLNYKRKIASFYIWIQLRRAAPPPGCSHLLLFCLCGCRHVSSGAGWRSGGHPAAAGGPDRPVQVLQPGDPALLQETLWKRWNGRRYDAGSQEVLLCPPVAG